MLKTIQAELTKEPEEIKVLNITWNTARKTQSPSFDQLIPNPEKYDLLMICF
jgi:hypothetical protein